MLHEKYKECIDICNECAVICESCVADCLNEEDVTEMAACIALARSCADICRMTATWMARDSEFTRQICALCIEVCQACGDEFAQFAELDYCHECAEVCYSCAEFCREMIGQESIA